jgi:hypothetical protein
VAAPIPRLGLRGEGHRTRQDPANRRIHGLSLEHSAAWRQRCFKGLERDVVVLVELRPDDERLPKLLYIGASRAKHHLIAVVAPELAQRLA